MDIAKYIGQFLLKNNYCYIHGLGNLELLKKPAVHDGKALLPPSYEVVVTSGGSIDDSFANFIATNEQISISKAANALRDFSIQSRTDLAAGRDVVIEGMGKFVEEKSKIRFITDPSFRFAPTGIPVLKNSRQIEEQKTAATRGPAAPATPATKAPKPKATAGTVNWTTIIIIIILLFLLAGGGAGYYYYTTQQKKEVVPVIDTVVTQVPPAIPDSMSMPPVTDTTQVAAVAQPVIDSNAKHPYRFVIGLYDRAGAEKRFRRLKVSGNPGLAIVTRDSVTYKIVLPATIRDMDTTHYVDSFRAFFGYKDVVIFREQ